MGIVTSGIPSEITLELAKLNNATVFVETGTFQGETTRWAANHFDSVFTIERAESIYRSQKEKLASLAGVKSLHGDSRNVLPSIVAEIGARKAVFWLDGHWSGGETAGADDECPLLDELACLSGRIGDIVLIDDARLFLCAPPQPHKASEWPTISDVVEALLRSHNRPYIQVIDDVIFAIPNEAPLKNCLINYAQERSNSFWQKYEKLQLEKSPRRGLRTFFATIRRRVTG
jgi:hypothetical protein